MTDEQIETYRKRLNDLTAQLKDNQKKEETIRPQLIELAREVGASTQVLYVRFVDSSTRSTEADSSELIKNIHQALQTASMANMCKTATQGYQIATKVSRDACIHYYIATAIAFLSAIAAWYAAIRN
jgi:uncharacterized protein YPO0396